MKEFFPIFITGFPGAGKTTLANNLKPLLESHGSVMVASFAMKLKQMFHSKFKLYDHYYKLTSEEKSKIEIVKGLTYRDGLIKFATDVRSKLGDDYFTKCVFDDFYSFAMKSNSEKNFLIIDDWRYLRESMFYRQWKSDITVFDENVPKVSHSSFNVHLTSGKYHSPGDNNLINENGNFIELEMVYCRLNAHKQEPVETAKIVYQQIEIHL